MDPNNLLALYISQIMEDLLEVQGEVSPQIPSEETLKSFNDFYEAMLAKGDTMEADVIKGLWMDPSFVSPFIKQLSAEEIEAISPGTTAFTKRDERGELSQDLYAKDSYYDSSEYLDFIPEGGWVDTLGVNPGDFQDFVAEYPHALAAGSLDLEERGLQDFMAMLGKGLFAEDTYGFGGGTTITTEEGKQFKTDKGEWMYPTWVNAPESPTGQTMATGDWKVYEKGQESLPLTYGDIESAGYYVGDRPPVEAWAHERIEPLLDKLMYVNMIKQRMDQDPEILDPGNSNFMQYLIELFNED